MCLAEKVVIDMLNSIKTVIETYENNRLLIDQREKETQDLLHELELSNLTPLQSLRLMRNLKEARMDRRKMKDENDTLEPLYNLLTKEYPKLKESLAKSHKEIIVKKNRQEARIYYPRVRSDLACGRLKSVNSQKCGSPVPGDCPGGLKADRARAK